MIFTRTKKGFTLIELLVVIAIIGVLSSVVLASLNTARERAANAKRLTDIRQIQNAMELFAGANSGNYPNLGTASNCGSLVPSWTSLQTALAPYMQTLPRDPAENCTLDRVYYVVSLSANYKIFAHNPPNPGGAPRSIWDPARDGGTNATIVDGNAPWAWALYTPGLAGN